MSSRDKIGSFSQTKFIAAKIKNKQMNKCKIKHSLEEYTRIPNHHNISDTSDTIQNYWTCKETKKWQLRKEKKR